MGAPKTSEEVFTELLEFQIDKSIERLAKLGSIPLIQILEAFMLMDKLYTLYPEEYANADKQYRHAKLKNKRGFCQEPNCFNELVRRDEWPNDPDLICHMDVQCPSCAHDSKNTCDAGIDMLGDGD